MKKKFKIEAKGSCLCGCVRYQVSGLAYVFQYCHCSRCRKSTGSAYAANIIVPLESFSWLAGEDMICEYALPDARYFSTCFCKQCGSSMPWKEQSGKSMIISAGTLDEHTEAYPIQNIFVGSHPQWYVDASCLPTHHSTPS